MTETCIKSDDVVELLQHIVARTGRTKVEVVTRALEAHLHTLESESRASRTLVLCFSDNPLNPA
jgi:hypothetical protein